MTTPQVKARTKTVTRRLGWWGLLPGDELIAVEKGQGLKKGERVKRLELIRVTCANGEALNSIRQDDVVREGFPTMTPAEFVVMFCKANRCEPDETVNRIQFSYVGPPVWF